MILYIYNQLNYRAQEKRPKVKNIRDYEKVAPTVIKNVLTEGLLKAGMPE